MAALEAGMDNLRQHIRNVREVWKLPVVVALNHFSSDTRAEIDTVLRAMDKEGVSCRFSDGWAKGGEGAAELAQCVADLLDKQQKQAPSFTYPEEAGLQQKIETLAKRVYHAGSVNFAGKSKAILKQLEEDGYGRVPVCIAKTQYSQRQCQAAECAGGMSLPSVMSDCRWCRLCGCAAILSPCPLPRLPAALQVDVDAAP